MYKTKACGKCEMPAPGTELKALVLNGSLKHSEDISNTEELAQRVLQEMRAHKVSSGIIRLADKNIPVGLGFKENNEDDWPGIVDKIKASDIVIFATPVWWGGRSSLIQPYTASDRADGRARRGISGGWSERTLQQGRGHRHYWQRGRGARDDGKHHDGSNMDGIHAAARVRGVLGWRGWPAGRRG